MTSPTADGRRTTVRGSLDGIINRPYGELAVALYASDMPVREPRDDRWALSQLAAWVRQGVDRLGGDQGVWQAAYRSRKHQLSSNPHVRDPACPDQRRARLAHDSAHRIMRGAGYAYSPDLRVKTVADFGDGSQWQQTVDMRDVLFAAMLRVTL